MPLIAGIGLVGLLAGHDKAGGASPASLIDVEMNTLGCLVIFVFATAWLIAVTASGSQSFLQRERRLRAVTPFGGGGAPIRPQLGDKQTR